MTFRVVGLTVPLGWYALVWESWKRLPLIIKVMKLFWHRCVKSLNAWEWTWIPWWCDIYMTFSSIWIWQGMPLTIRIKRCCLKRNLDFSMLWYELDIGFPNIWVLQGLPLIIRVIEVIQHRWVKSWDVFPLVSRIFGWSAHDYKNFP